MFREELRQNPIEGICDCVDGVWKPKLHGLIRLKKLQRFNVHPTLTAAVLDQPGWKRKDLVCKGKIKCRCSVSSSARMFGDCFLN